MTTHLTIRILLFLAEHFYTGEHKEDLKTLCTHISADLIREGLRK